MGCSSSKVRPESRNSAQNKDFHAEVAQDKWALVTDSQTKAKSPMQLQRLKVLTRLNSEVEKYLAREDRRPAQKALFLGTGESGKSTIFKQMRLCYGNSFTEFERAQYAKLIWVDSLRAIRSLVDMCDEERRMEKDVAGLRKVVTNWIGDHLLNTDPNGVRPYLELIQSLNLSRRAFLEAERDPSSRAFLHNHVNGGAQPVSPVPRDSIYPVTAEPDVPKTYLSQAMLGKYKGVDDLEEMLLEERFLGSTALQPTRANICDAATVLWRSCPDKIRRMVAANQLGLETNAAYFLDRLFDLREPDYLASDLDILHARIKTTGITTAEFNVKSNKLVVMDVGGQRVERRKWIHNFDDVTCILFVASVSEYDQGLEEESSVNRLEESLAVFEQTVNSQWFRAKSVQLFLNKTDVLEKKCRYSSFRRHFTQYPGRDDDPSEIVQYIEQLFRDRFRHGSRNLYVHRTCATDTTTMKFVVGAVSDMILFENLKWAGMV